MTEKDFLKQVWRAYDTVELENGIKGRVMNICFSTRSVRVVMPDGNPEWFRFNFVKEHISVASEPDDMAIIENLHNKLMDADNKINWLQEEKKRLEEKLSDNHIEKIKKNLNELLMVIDGKKKRVEKVEKCIEDLGTIISKIEGYEKGQ